MSGLERQGNLKRGLAYALDMYMGVRMQNASGHQGRPNHFLVSGTILELMYKNGTGLCAKLIFIHFVTQLTNQWCLFLLPKQSK